MDSNRFDALTRNFGLRRSRRDALKAFAGGLVGIGLARGASAQVSTEAATCGQTCTRDSDCNAGLRCGSNRICVAKTSSKTSCNRNINCSNNYEICNKNGRCVNQVKCNRCETASDCANPKQGCRNGRCGECNRDRDCRSNEVCKNGRCKRGKNRCNRNSDCPRNRKCRNGRCKKK
ncbi:MAG: hypothetical protein IT338_04715 [Thermomicrobiales bacterium]|nr:hypothetical protein [Thermomicrobiales bacterium]